MTPKSFTFILLGMSLATFLGWLDLTIVNTALPAMQQSFQVDDRSLQWIMNALLLALASLMVLAGKLADRYGRRRLLYFGFLLLIASSAGAALSDSFISLVAFRFLQGVSIAIIYTAPMAAISSLAPDKIAKSIGVLVGVGGLGLALGPVCGGLLVSTCGWHAIFWLNIPFILIAFLFCLAGRFPETKSSNQESLDILGAVLMTLLLFLLVFTTVNVRSAPIHISLISYALVLALGWWFVMHENRFRFPVIDFHLFANRAFIVGVIANFFLAFFYCIEFFFIPLHMHALGYQSSMTIGLILLPPSLIFAVTSLFTEGIGKRIGIKHTLLFGYTCFIISAILQILLISSTNLWLLMIPYVLLGFGWALILPTAFGAALTSLPTEMAGVGMGSIGSMHNFGGTVGLAIGATLGYGGAMGLITGTSLLAFMAILFGLKAKPKVTKLI